MLFNVLACPQCGAPLPRQARWRMVTCPNCGSMVSRAEEVVQAARFKEAYARSQATPASGLAVRYQSHRYQILGSLGRGAHSDVYLGQRLGPGGERVTVKLARPGHESGRLAQEASVLRSLMEADPTGGVLASQHLPQVEGVGSSEGPFGLGQELLLLRHPTGFWGTLSDVLHLNPRGIDPKHAIWMWRRMLGALGFVHDRNWVHTDLAPEHLLVHPQDHGIRIIGWGHAQVRVEAPKDLLSQPTVTRDLAQSAWSTRAVLSGMADASSIPSRVPDPLADLLHRCCEDLAWCATQTAQSLDHLLKEASRQAYGPPTFIPFIPEA
ncbi:MAG: protein kinase family protein [Acidobacteria bacterium]|nr:protein kinase family protein [Acidobacteriota bacterium]MBI3489660.1 protein kinase family protein [Acidobacteriota bacterium]